MIVPAVTFSVLDEVETLNSSYNSNETLNQVNNTADEEEKDGDVIVIGSEATITDEITEAELLNKGKEKETADSASTGAGHQYHKTSVRHSWRRHLQVSKRR